MARQNNNKEEIISYLQECLEKQPTLFISKDDFIELLKEKRSTSPSLSRDILRIIKVVENSQISEEFLNKNEESAEVKAEFIEAIKADIAKALNNDDEDHIQFVVDVFANALRWNEEAETDADEESEAETTDEADDEENKVEEKVTKEESETKPAAPVDSLAEKATATSKDTKTTSKSEIWQCICGWKTNKGKFCTVCGRNREEGEQQPEPAKPVEKTAAAPPPPPPAPKPEPRQEPKPEPVQPVTPTPATSRQSAAKSDTVTLSKKTIAIVAVVVVVLLGYFFNKGSNNNNANDKPSAAPTVSTQAPAKSSKPEKKEPEMQSDLSLGGLDLDLTVDEMRNILGKENSKENQDGYTFFIYDSLQVGVSGDQNNSPLTTLVSDGSKVKTKRGIHEGSTLDDVVAAYGNDCQKFDYNDLMLYEYTFKTIKGNVGILRFAIKKSNCVVSYISARIPKSKDEIQDVSVSKAMDVLDSYHQAITDKNYNAAYNLLTSSRQQNMGGTANFAKGYETTLSSKITSKRMISHNDDTVVIEFDLEAKDTVPGRSSIVTSKFHGKATIKQVNGKWLLDDVESKKIN